MNDIVIRKPVVLLLLITAFILTIFYLTKPSPVSDFANQSVISDLANAKDLNSSSVRTKCEKVSMDELDQWFELGKSNKITKVIHQTWKTASLRPKQARWSETWCEHYKDWKYRLWTDEENDKFVRTKFPWFYATYSTLSPGILRADSVRYMYMYYYGGIYVDLDYEALKPVDQLLTDKSVVLAIINYSFDSMNSVPNSWFASKPNHPMWTYVLQRTMILWSRTSDDEKKNFWDGKAEFFTGPHSLFEGLMFYLHTNRFTKATLNELMGDKARQTSNAILQVDDITFLGPKLMNAYDWMTRIGSDVCSAEKPTFDEKKCQKTVEPIYAITYWSHSYGHGHQSDSKYLS